MADLPITLSRCPISTTVDLGVSRTIAVVPKTHEGILTDKQLVDYKAQRVQFLSWLVNDGKTPEKPDGYSPYRVSNTAYCTAQFDRWVWDQKARYHYPPDAHDALRPCSCYLRGGLPAKRAGSFMRATTRRSSTADTNSFNCDTSRTV